MHSEARRRRGGSGAVRFRGLTETARLGTGEPHTPLSLSAPSERHTPLSCSGDNRATADLKSVEKGSQLGGREGKRATGFRRGTGARANKSHGGEQNRAAVPGTKRGGGSGPRRCTFLAVGEPSPLVATAVVATTAVLHHQGMK
jgi:hypothetical protein